MKERASMRSLEKRFNAVSSTLSEQFRIKNQGFTGPFLRVASNERDGGAEALTIDSNGEWDKKIFMDSFPIGKNPSANTLIEVYAEIKDSKYRALQPPKIDEDNSPERVQYLSRNRNRLLVALVKEVENRLRELNGK